MNSNTLNILNFLTRKKISVVSAKIKFIISTIGRKIPIKSSLYSSTNQIQLFKIIWLQMDI